MVCLSEVSNSFEICTGIHFFIFLCCLHLMRVFIFLVKFGLLSGHL